jgi:putative MATE family efflux protein
MCNAILLAHGDSKTFGKVIVTGFFLNLIFDPWFLYGGFGLPAMGIKGIAYATVLIQALSSAYLLMTVIRRGYLKKCLASSFAPQMRIYREILKQGIPTSFNMMSIALGFFVMTYYLNGYGQAAVAAFGVGTRIEQMVLLPAIGLSAAIVSIVGQNNGAGELKRVNECVRLCAKYGIILIVTSSLAMFSLATPLVRLFTDDPEVISVGTTYVRIVATMQWAYVMSFVFIGFLQAVKRPMYGFVESIVRKIILPLGLFYLLVNVWDVNLTTFWWGSVGINIAVAIVTIFYGRHILHKVTSGEDEV